MRAPAHTFCGIAVLFLLVITASYGVADESLPPNRPNIIFILADDLGYGHLGCYGQRKIRTPHLDRLATEGMRFTRFYAGAAVCAPSRCVLMTGLHTGHSSVRGNTGGIPLLDEDVTLAEVLKSAGYATGLFGKWGLGEHGTPGVPYRQGFDEFFGYLHQIHAHFYYPEYLWQNDRRYPLPGNANGQRREYTHDVIVEKALDFVRRRHNEPFFLYIPFAVPHYELLVPEDSLKQYRGKFPETPYTGRGRKTGYPHDYATQKTPKAALAAMITRMDNNVGRIVDLLDELELADNTLVLFTSDNGPSGGPGDPDFFRAAGPLRGSKRFLYEGGIRVPLIASWPGRIEAGAVNAHVWYFADILPTLAELAGAESPAGIDGISAVPSLLGEEAAARRQRQHEFLYWEHPDAGARAARMGDWKAVIPGPEAPLELYDLGTDEREQNNVADRHPEIAGKIESYMNSAHTPSRPQIEPEKPAGRQYR